MAAPGQSTLRTAPAHLLPQHLLAVAYTVAGLRACGPHCAGPPPQPPARLPQDLGRVASIVQHPSNPRPPAHLPQGALTTTLRPLRELIAGTAAGKEVQDGRGKEAKGRGAGPGGIQCKGAPIAY